MRFFPPRLRLGRVNEIDEMRISGRAGHKSNHDSECGWLLYVSNWSKCTKTDESRWGCIVEVSESFPRLSINFCSWLGQQVLYYSDHMFSQCGAL